MAKYTATVVATVEDGQLDKLEQRIKTLEKTPIKLTVDTSSMNVANVTSQMQKQYAAAGTKAGQAAGKAISNGINSAAKSVTIKEFSEKFDNAADQLKNVFSNLHIDADITSDIEEKLNGTIDRIDKIKASISSTGTATFDVSGVNKFGDSVSTTLNVVKSLNAEGQEVSKVIAEFGTVINDVSGNTAAIKAQAEAFSQLETVVNRIGDINVKLLKTDSADTATIEHYTQELQELGAEYERLQSELSGTYSDAQWTQYTASLGNVESKISETEAKLQDLRTKAEQKIQPQIDGSGWKNTTETIEESLRSLESKGSSSVSALRNEFEQLKTTRNELTQLSGTELIAGFDKYSKQLSTLKTNLDTAKKSMQGFATAAQITNTSKSFETWLSKNSKAFDAYGDKIDEIRKKLKDFASDSSTTTGQLQEVSTEIKQLQATAAAEGNTGVSWVSKLGDQFKKLSTYVSAATVIYKAISALKSMYSNVKEIDSALVELKKVTDETDATYESFLDNAKTKAIELGTSVSDLVNSTADFARLGYTIEESANLAQVATIYANVGKILPNNAVMYCKQVAISVKGRRRFRPRKDLLGIRNDCDALISNF